LHNFFVEFEVVTKGPFFPWKMTFEILVLVGQIIYMMSWTTGMTQYDVLDNMYDNKHNKHK